MWHHMVGKCGGIQYTVRKGGWCNVRKRGWYTVGKGGWYTVGKGGL